MRMVLLEQEIFQEMQVSQKQTDSITQEYMSLYISTAASTGTANVAILYRLPAWRLSHTIKQQCTNMSSRYTLLFIELFVVSCYSRRSLFRCWKCYYVKNNDHKLRFRDSLYTVQHIMCYSNVQFTWVLIGKLICISIEFWIVIYIFLIFYQMTTCSLQSVLLAYR